jgi:hypothetical protein
MSTELLIALISLGSALIGLTAALIGRKKVVEIRYVNTEQPPLKQKEPITTLPEKLRWYDKTFWLVFWTIIFWPLGLYGVLKSRAVSKNWKIFVVVCFVILMIASQNKT